MLKIFVRNPSELRFGKVPVAKKFLSHSAERFRRRGDYQGFPSKIFCITTENFPDGNPLVFPYFRLWNKFGKERGSIKDFRRKIFVSQCRKTSYKNPAVFHYFRVSKSFRL